MKNRAKQIVENINKGTHMIVLMRDHSISEPFMSVVPIDSEQSEILKVVEAEEFKDWVKTSKHAWNNKIRKAISDLL